MVGNLIRGISHLSLKEPRANNDWKLACLAAGSVFVLAHHDVYRAALHHLVAEAA